MRILLFGGGLGNQIFEYAFYLYIKRLFPNAKVYGVYNRFWLNEHNGLEINKFFDVQLPPRSLYSDVLSVGFYLYKKVCPKSRFLDLNTKRMENETAIFFNAYKLNKQYIPKEHDWLAFKNEIILQKENEEILKKIKSVNSYFIHVRRGDYLSPKYKSRFSNTCTIEYYLKAISIVKKKVDHPTFFCFSDDIEWMKANMNIENAVYVDWNIGDTSFVDLLLMSYCEGGIIANSTFSYWGARLGKRKEIVIYPLKWINSKEMTPNIFPNSWIGI